MLNKSKIFLQEASKLTGIPLTVTYEDQDRVGLCAQGLGETDSFQIVCDFEETRGGSFSIEVFPCHDEPVAIFEYSTLEETIKTFEVLYCYRKVAILPKLEECFKDV